MHRAVRSLEFGHRAIARVLVKARRPGRPLPRVVIIDRVKFKVARRLFRSGLIVVGKREAVVIFRVIPLPIVRGLLGHAEQ